MKTPELIDFLSKQLGPADVGLANKKAWITTCIGLPSATGLAMVLLGPIPTTMVFELGLWTKLIYTSLLACVTAWLFVRVSKPAMPFQQAVLGMGAVIAGALLFGCLFYLSNQSDQKLMLIAGHSWLACPWLIAIVSLPGLLGSLWSMRGLAPTRPSLAGFACGAFAGSLGAMGYSLACTESSPTFVSLWYTLGILLVGGLGALLGPRVLRW
ncbi:MAG TPA: DUF1109 domain-containing protein [Limnobacter sp.]|nr:DUF1109 domain-containing protein [Limnobacter sp.]